MKFTLSCPVSSRHGLVEPEVLSAVARAAEDAGFSALGFTDHPAPSVKWTAHGGHETLDPLTALAFVAGVTTHLRLMTYLLVLPYRNPVLAAKQVATVDRVSGGRLTLAVGSGYLRSEFAALGQDFDARQQSFDDALKLVGRAWSEPTLRLSGPSGTVLEQHLGPPPAQRPHPPLWIGGNTRRARRRAVAHGQGWSPLLRDTTGSDTTRTATIATPDDLATAVTDLHHLAEEAGRDPASLDVQADWADASDLSSGDERALDAVGRLAEAGATWAVVDLPAREPTEMLETIARYGAAVVQRTGR